VGETLSGLRELGLTEIAGYFEQTWKFLEPYRDALRSGDFGARNSATGWSTSAFKR